MAKKNDRVEGENCGFLTTQGKPRYSYMQGKHYVVGRGVAEEFATLIEAYRRRDALLREEKERAEAKKAAAKAKKAVAK